MELLEVRGDRDVLVSVDALLAGRISESERLDGNRLVGGERHNHLCAGSVDNDARDTDSPWRGSVVGHFHVTCRTEWRAQPVDSCLVVACPVRSRSSSTLDSSAR